MIGTYFAADVADRMEVEEAHLSSKSQGGVRTRLQPCPRSERGGRGSKSLDRCTFPIKTLTAI
jgi:hypothetical protein